jgi:hypothetical protein
MQEKNEDWFDEVFSSMRGHIKASPPNDLFEKINRQINTKEGKIINLRRMSISGAAAAVILIINVFTLYNYTQTSTNQSVENVSDVYDQSLISPYQIYE